tara:strand:+ start:70 stop:738 length:669 start_codon:yes stop_codon:yes gene_type:complete
MVSILLCENNDWDEILNYSAYFSGIHIANATLKSKQIINSINQEILTIEFSAKSKSTFKYIYIIDDIISIDVEKKTWEPIRVEKKLREGDYIHNSITKFNKDERKFIFNNDTISYPEKVMNPYSMIYFFRNQPLNPNINFKINIVDNKKIIPLKFNVNNKEGIKTPIGNFQATKIWPERIDGEPFKNAGKMTIWYSETEKIPLIINLKLKFGSLNLELIEIN